MTEKDYNIFNCIGMNHYEIKHSNFLAWLFNPKGEHGLGIKFLNCFLAKVYHGKFLMREENTTVTREENDIDILIVDKYNKKVCVIENKVYAKEGKGQLEKYWVYVNEKYTGYDKRFIYMSLNGEEPSFPEYRNITYKEVEQTIEECLSEDISLEKTKILLTDYKDLLTMLSTASNDDFRNSLSEIIKNKIESKNYTLLTPSANKFMVFYPSTLNNIIEEDDILKTYIGVYKIVNLNSKIVLRCNTKGKGKKNNSVAEEEIDFSIIRQYRKRNNQFDNESKNKIQKKVESLLKKVEYYQ